MVLSPVWWNIEEVLKSLVEGISGTYSLALPQMSPTDFCLWFKKKKSYRLQMFNVETRVNEIIQGLEKNMSKYFSGKNL